MKNKVIRLLMLCITIVGYAQKRYIADAYFNDYAYKKSAEVYEKIYKKNRAKDYLVISRLADSYYFNSETEKAKIWYEKLVSNFGNRVLKKHLLRYAQVLRSNGDHEVSETILKERGINFTEVSNEENLITEHYISQFTNNTDVKNVKIHNVAINTPYSDFGGFLHNNSFYFSSSASKNKRNSKKYKWNNQPYLNIYAATLRDTLSAIDSTSVVINDLEDKQFLSKKVNTKLHEASMIITKDGKTMYFTRASYNKRRARSKKESTALLKLYRATLINNKWQRITKLPFNSQSYSVGQPALSLDEKTLYFVSDMKGGFGSTDIYKVAIHANNGFGKPENLGAKVNTQGKEMFPFIGAKNMLYFSSNGYTGLGGLDIYEAQMSENDEIGAVKNLNAPFNSNLDDFAFVVDASIQKGFFSSNRSGGKGDDDIYSFSVDKSSILEAIKPLESPIEPIILNDTILTNTIVAKINKDGENNQKDSVENLEPKNALIANNEIITNPVYFDFNSSTIRRDVEPELDKVIDMLAKNPELVIKIESHTDSRGSKDYNKKLSDKRAKATLNYIISKGIPLDRIESAIGYGEDKLLYKCTSNVNEKCSEDVHQKNRRSYFYVINNNENGKNKHNQEAIAERIGETLDSNNQSDMYISDSDLVISENRIVTNPIYFNFNKHTIRYDAKPELEKIIRVMKDNPEMIIKIESHTDSRGSGIYNKILSNKRAAATRDYIISNGIASHRIKSAIGYGEDKLLNNCNDVNQKKCSDDAHQINRRSYFYIVNNKQNRVTSK